MGRFNSKEGPKIVVSDESGSVFTCNEPRNSSPSPKYFPIEDNASTPVLDQQFLDPKLCEQEHVEPYSNGRFQINASELF